MALSYKTYESVLPVKLAIKTPGVKVVTRKNFSNPNVPFVDLALRLRLASAKLTYNTQCEYPTTLATLHAPKHDVVLMINGKPAFPCEAKITNMNSELILRQATLFLLVVLARENNPHHKSLDEILDDTDSVEMPYLYNLLFESTEGGLKMHCVVYTDLAILALVQNKTTARNISAMKYIQQHERTFAEKNMFIYKQHIGEIVPHQKACIKPLQYFKHIQHALQLATWNDAKCKIHFPKTFWSCYERCIAKRTESELQQRLRKLELKLLAYEAQAYVLGI